MEINRFKTLENKLIRYRNKVVVMDSDVAELYGATTKEINQAVSNNQNKLPNIHMLVLTKEEKSEQKELAEKSNHILEDGEIIETTTKFEFNLNCAKVSRSIKK